MVKHTEYSSLPQDEDSTSDPPLSPKLDAELPEKIASRFIRWATALILVTTVADALILIYIFTRYVSPGMLHPSSPSPTPLELGNTYINFDRLYRRNNSHLQVISSVSDEPITNIGRSFGWVSSAEPKKVFHQWPDLWMTEYGRIPINNRRVWATTEISTIAQFRVIDYGMESCALAFALPAVDGSDNDSIVGSLGEFEVWTLDAPTKLDLQLLSWDTRPSRVKLLGTLSIPASLNDTTTQELPRFECQWGEYWTFELSCSEPNCYVDISSTHDKAEGFYMRQYRTV